MKACIGIFVFVFLAAELSAYTNPREIASPRFSAGIGSERIMRSGYTFERMPVFGSAGPYYALRSIHVMPASLIFLPMSKGVPFCRGAVFCRMENHFLNTYNVKFSIHTGGFRE